VRKAMLVLVVACTTLSLAATAASASEPLIFHIHGVDRGPGQPFVIPAGVACPFEMRLDSEGKQTIWLFSDGDESINVNNIQTLTNLETGWSVVRRSDYHQLTFHNDDGTTLQVVHGSFLFVFLEGDQGPNGVVGPGGETYLMIGTATVTFGTDGAITAFSQSGQMTDACQLLSA